MALVIIGHPDLANSVANKTIIEQLRKSKVDLEIRNIMDMYPGFNIDASAEQQALLRHQTVVLQYPLYWYNMPAILKHWFDVVFTYGFAYGSKGDKLKGKNLLPSFTVGAPASEYCTLGEHHFRVLEFCKNLEQTAYYAQMNFIDPFYIHNTSVSAGYEPEMIAQRATEHAGKLVSVLKDLTIPCMITE